MNTKGYHSPMDYLTAARTSSSSDELACLARSEYEFVRLAVAQNPNVTSSILLSLVPEGFATWNQQELAGAVSKNPKAPQDALRKIAVGLRPFLNFRIRRRIANKCSRRDVLELLVTDPSEAVTLRALRALDSAR